MDDENYKDNEYKELSKTANQGKMEGYIGQHKEIGLQTEGDVGDRVRS